MFGRWQNAHILQVASNLELLARKLLLQDNRSIGVSLGYYKALLDLSVELRFGRSLLFDVVVAVEIFSYKNYVRYMHA